MILYQIDAIHFFSKHYWQERIVVKRMDNYFEKIVESIRKQPAKNHGEQKKFIDFLLDEKNEFSKQNIVDQVKAMVYGVKLHF
jgi:cytochrome P450